jgi:hypothetical protein
MLQPNLDYFRMAATGVDPKNARPSGLSLIYNDLIDNIEYVIRNNAQDRRKFWYYCILSRNSYQF